MKTVDPRKFFAGYKAAGTHPLYEKPAPAPRPKELHKMTFPEYVESMRGVKVEHTYYSRKGQLIENHKTAILHALQLGKEVRQSVINSLPYPIYIYPQWAQKALQESLEVF